MVDTLDMRQLAEARGKDLVSTEGIKVGQVREIIYDYFSGNPIWVGVGSAEQPKFRTLLVPVRGITSEANRLRSSETWEKIEKQPHADFGEGFDSMTEEGHLYAYFKLDLNGEPELRILREGDDLPGLEAVTNE